MPYDDIEIRQQIENKMNDWMIKNNYEIIVIGDFNELKNKLINMLQELELI
jgi:hypothetical protein